MYHNTPSNSYANLVGNPYPSAIDLDRFFEVNAGLIDPVAYIWGRGILSDTPDPNNPGPYPISYSEDNYFIYNPTMAVTSINSSFNGVFNDFNFDGDSDSGTLASCQSFFVTTSSGAGNLVFNNSMRTTAVNNTFVRMSDSFLDEEENKLWLNLSVNKSSEQIGIAFLEAGTDKFNSKEDVKAIYGRKLNLYTKTTEEDLIIDVQNVFNDNKVIPLGITSLKNYNQDYKIEVVNITGKLKNKTIFLEDKILNRVVNITNSPYTFKLDSKITDGAATQINISQLQNGLYVLQVHSDDGVFSYKFIKE